MCTYSALLSVQVELVLADGHGPNGFDQRMAGIPRVDQKARLTEGALGYCSPGATKNEPAQKSEVDAEVFNHSYSTNISHLNAKECG